MTPLPSTLPDSVARCAIAVTAYFGALFGSLEGIGERAFALFEPGRPVTAAVLSELVEPLARATLADHPVVGAGFVVTPGALSDRELHLAWWQGEEQQPLPERGVPIGHHVFDYTRHEWFRTPLATGLRHVTGPYVDYVCTDEYVLTATVPVLVRGEMVGVAGGDTRLETFEQLMREPLHGAGGVALINTHDRVVVAADPLLRSGQKVALTEYAAAHPLPGLPFRVLAQNA